MKEKKFVIAYDVSDTRRRRYVVKFLEDYAYRMQYSLYEMSGTEDNKNKLVKSLLDILDTKEDSLLVYELDSNSWNNRERYGQAIKNDIFYNGPVIL